jgi:hypothetical protein
MIASTSTGPVFSGFQNNYIWIRGVPLGDTTATSVSQATNGIVIETSRNSGQLGLRNQLQAGDTVGYLAFRAQNTSSAVTNVGVNSAQIYGTVTEIPTSTAAGGRVYVTTLNTGTVTQGNRLILDNLQNSYQSAVHQFASASGITRYAQVSSYGLILQKGLRNSFYDWSGGGTISTAAGTYNIDASSGTVHSVLLGGNITLSGMLTTSNGNSLTIILTQDGIGNRTLTTTGSWVWQGGVKTLSTVAGSIDLLKFEYYGGVYYAELRKGYTA